MAGRAWTEARRRGAVYLLCLTVAVAAGCGPMPRPQRQPGEGPGGRSQPLGMSPAQELEVGRRAYRQVMDELRDRILPDDSEPAVRVRRVSGRLIKAAQIEPLQREINLRLRGYRLEWEAHVVRDRQVNAFCLPGGKVFVFTGILRVTGDSDDYLATVLSHEIAHALAHHASERPIAREKSGQGVLRSLSYGRLQEEEADHIGIFLMAFAGYDPKRAPEFWQRMQQARGGESGLPEFLSSHPSNASRIRNLRAWAPDAVAAKRAFDRGHVQRARQ